jgi:hypothetical protein
MGLIWENRDFPDRTSQNDLVFWNEFTRFPYQLFFAAL